MQAAAKDCDQPGFFVMDCSDWQIIPAENLVAAFQVFYSYSQIVQLQQDLLKLKHQCQDRVILHLALKLL